MSADTNEPEWPADLLDLSAVHDWIATTLSDGAGSVELSGPVEIYQNKGWGVTARFATRLTSTTRTQERLVNGWHDTGVIFKASALPLFAYSPSTYELLMPYVPRQVPEMLAWSRSGSQTWTLFRQFHGKSISSSASLSDLKDIARTMARIQVEIASLPKETMSKLPHFSVRDIPALFDEVLDDIHEQHLAFWCADNSAIARRFDLPSRPHDVLANFRRSVRAWSEELVAGSWPESIDHVDLQSDNVIRLADGNVLIYDWEEAVISCPFFSVDRLLDDARELGVSAAEKTVRDAYIEAIPWYTFPERDRALDLALCLSPIKSAYECKRFTKALGRELAFSNLTAFCISRALNRWQTMDVASA